MTTLEKEVIWKSIVYIPKWYRVYSKFHSILQQKILGNRTYLSERRKKRSFNGSFKASVNNSRSAWIMLASPHNTYITHILSIVVVTFMIKIARTYHFKKISLFTLLLLGFDPIHKRHILTFTYLYKIRVPSKLLVSKKTSSYRHWTWYT